MIPITFNSADAYLIDDAPDWVSPPQLQAQAPANGENGLTGREARTPLAEKLRLSLSYSAILEDSEQVTNFRNALQDLADKVVLCPLWVYPIEAGATPDVTADFYALLGDGADPEIGEAADLPFDRPAYPLLVGKLKTIPDPIPFDDEKAAVTIDFEEAEEWAITLPAFAPGSDVFPFRPNWAQRPKSGNAEVYVERQKIGQRRQDAKAYYDQRSRRHVEQGFTLEDLEPWQLLRLFQDSHGTAGTFWLPTGISDARLTADVDAADTALTVDNPTGRGENTVVVLDDLANRVRLTITGTAGSDWNLSGAVGTDFLAAFTRIESAAYARFDTDTLTLTFDEPSLARVTLPFVETPWEVSAVSGETIGTTMGELPVMGYCYVFSIAYPGATQTWRYTGFETDTVDGSANTYAGGFFQHDSIHETLTLDRQQVNLSSRNFSGNPLALMIPFQLEWPLKLEIYEVEISAGVATNFRALFVGEVETASYDGPFIKASARSLSSIFERRIPRRLLQPGCNYAVFESGCGLLLANWKWQGTVTAYNASTLEVTIDTISRVSGSAVTLTAHYFAGGFMYFGSGAAAQYRMIADNTVPSGGSMVLTLAQPLTNAPTVGTILSFHPGCSGSKEDCGAAKFNNLARFGGFPFMPAGNPSAIKVSKNATSGGKK